MNSPPVGKILQTFVKFLGGLDFLANRIGVDLYEYHCSIVIVGRGRPAEASRSRLSNALHTRLISLNSSLIFYYYR